MDGLLKRFMDIMGYQPGILCKEKLMDKKEIIKYFEKLIVDAENSANEEEKKWSGSKYPHWSGYLEQGIKSFIQMIK